MNVVGYYWMMFKLQGLMRVALDHPDAPPVRFGPGGPAIHVAPGHPVPDPNFFPTLVVGIGIGMAVFVALMIAAVWRRLHDRGRTGAWGLLPVLFSAISLAGMTRLFGSADVGRGGMPAAFPIVFVSNLCYLASALTLVIMLAGIGTPGANEFGPAPE